MRDVLGEEAYKHIAPRLDRAMKGERVFFEQEMPYVTGTRDIAAHYIPDVAADGRVRGCFALIEDVSARKRAERALRESGSAARTSSSPCWRTSCAIRWRPIRNVATCSPRARPTRRRSAARAQMIERQASHLTHLVDDLLDVARITRGRIVLKRETLNLADRADTALETVQPLLDFADRRCRCAARRRRCSWMPTGAALPGASSNLLTNAIKYSPIARASKSQSLGTDR